METTARAEPRSTVHHGLSSRSELKQLLSTFAPCVSLLPSTAFDALPSTPYEYSLLANVGRLSATLTFRRPYTAPVTTTKDLGTRSWHTFPYLMRDAMPARHMLSSCVCLSVRPSVCLSVTNRSSTKMAKLRITQTTPYDSHGTDATNTGKINPTGSPQGGGGVK